MKPIGNQILIERVEPETKTAGGLFIPEIAQEQQKQAKIIALGSGVPMKNGKRRPFAVKAGDMVMIGNCPGAPEIRENGREMLLIMEGDIFGIIETQ